MGKIKELYDTRVRPMTTAERLQLARLILDDLAPADHPVDVRDDWSDDDVADIAAFSARQGERSGPDAAAGDANEKR